MHGALVQFSATDFVREESVNIFVNHAFNDLVTNSEKDNEQLPQKLVYHFYADPGEYELKICYAADEIRPVSVYVNGNLITDRALAKSTNGWTRIETSVVGSTLLNSGVNTLVISRETAIPHLQQITFTPQW